jgi:translation initiation factor 2B subunit (eIF-2B alpha/beta/delta family)
VFGIPKLISEFLSLINSIREDMKEAKLKKEMLSKINNEAKDAVNKAKDRINRSIRDNANGSK